MSLSSGSSTESMLYRKLIKLPAIPDIVIKIRQLKLHNSNLVYFLTSLTRHGYQYGATCEVQNGKIEVIFEKKLDLKKAKKYPKAKNLI